MDEVFGRASFVGELIWQKRTSRENRAALSSSHDALYLYAKKGAKEWKKHRNLLLPNDGGFSNPDGDRRGPWKSVPFSAQGYRENQMYKIVAPDGTVHEPPKGRCWGATEPQFLKMRDIENSIYFPKGGKGRPRVKQFPEQQNGLVPMTLWPAREVGDNEDAKKESLSLFPDREAFGTPKPEALLQRVIHIATNQNDLVLDSFLGSGTTSAVAQKMGRRWIGIEMGGHAATHCLPRLQKVLEGEQGGISEAVGWQGGGGFRFLKLGEPVFHQDGRINPQVRFAALASYLWFLENGAPHANGVFESPLLGVSGEGETSVAHVLLFNGILGDRRPAGGNVLTSVLWPYIENLVPNHGGRWVIYGEASRMPESRRRALGVTFKQIPYDIRMK